MKHCIDKDIEKILSNTKDIISYFNGVLGQYFL